MSTQTGQVDQQSEVTRYKVQYPVSAYTFPREARSIASASTRSTCTWN